MRAVVGGLIGGAFGALLWAGVVLFTGYEVGWIAWIVGGLVGFGVAAGNADGGRSSTAAGTLAVVIAAVSILAGKYAGVQAAMPNDDEIVAMFMEGFAEEEYVVSYVADEVVGEFESQGRPVSWPPGVDPATASTEVEYPADVWAEAQTRWRAFSEAERVAFREAREAEVMENISGSLPEIRAVMAEGGFLGSFSPIDVIFFGLSMATAFGVGSGAGKTREEIAEEYAQAVQLAMIRVMIADGEVDEQEVHTVSEVYRQLTGTEVSADVIRAKATLAQSQGRDLQAALIELAPHLSDEGKGTVLKAAVMVAAADGEFEASEQALISEIANALGMSEDQVRDTVAELTQAA